MAKIEEADPRWIVKERADGQNVNAWHWEEKDLTKATHTNISSSLKDLTLCDADGADGGLSLKVKEVSEISGDLCVAQRKGRIMCYFDLKLTAKYEGRVNGEKVEGKFVIPEVDHDTFDKDYTVEVAALDTRAPSQTAEAWCKSTGRAKIRAAIAEVIRSLFAEFKVGTNAKTGGAAAAAGGSPVTGGSPATPPTAAAKGATYAVGGVSPGSSSAKGSIDWRLDWRVPPQELWTVLTDQARASAYTRAPARIDPRPTGAFEYLGGVISGYFTEVVHPSKLTMQWRLSSWPSGVFSSVVMVLTPEEANVTRLEFAQAGIPEGEVERVRQGWQVNFWDAIKMVFGYQMTIVD